MKREEAKAIIEALVTLREAATDEQAALAPSLYPKWRVGINYKTGGRILCDGILYKVLSDHTSQSDWIPGEASSLYAKVLIIDSDMIPEWEQPDSTNAYMIGDKVTHDGFTWLSLVDNNVWEPTDEVPTLWEKQTSNE